MVNLLTLVTADWSRLKDGYIKIRTDRQKAVPIKLLKKVQEYAAYRQEDTSSIYLAAVDPYADYINNLITSDKKWADDSGYNLRSLNGFSSSSPNEPKRLSQLINTGAETIVNKKVSNPVYYNNRLLTIKKLLRTAVGLQG